MEKLAQLHLPDYTYNWLVDFFAGHSHCTVYHGQASKSITASIIQGSGIGPAAYVVNASDPKAVTPGNQLQCKFADDTYLVIPASNVDSRATERDNIETWAGTNNLTLNRNKSKEIVFSDPRRRRQIESLPSATDIARVTSVKILGVTMTNGLSASDHVRDVIRSCARPACVTRRCRPSSGQSPSPSCSMHPVPGLGSPKRLTGSESTVSYVAASAVVTARQTLLHLPNNAPLYEQLFDIICHNQNHVLYSLLLPLSRLTG